MASKREDRAPSIWRNLDDDAVLEHLLSGELIDLPDEAHDRIQAALDRKADLLRAPAAGRA